MTPKPATNWELAIVLPLGVIGHHLSRVEEQLRVAGMRAVELGGAVDQRPIRQAVQGKLERIRELLGSIDALVADIEDDIQPAAVQITPTAQDD